MWLFITTTVLFTFIKKNHMLICSDLNTAVYETSLCDNILIAVRGFSLQMVVCDTMPTRQDILMFEADVWALLNVVKRLSNAHTYTEQWHFCTTAEDDDIQRHPLQRCAAPRAPAKLVSQTHTTHNSASLIAGLGIVSATMVQPPHPPLSFPFPTRLVPLQYLVPPES